MNAPHARVLMRLFDEVDLRIMPRALQRPLFSNPDEPTHSGTIVASASEIQRGHTAPGGWTYV